MSLRLVVGMASYSHKTYEICDKNLLTCHAMQPLRYISICDTAITAQTRKDLRGTKSSCQCLCLDTSLIRPASSVLMASMFDEVHCQAYVAHHVLKYNLTGSLLCLVTPSLPFIMS